MLYQVCEKEKMTLAEILSQDEEDKIEKLILGNNNNGIEVCANNSYYFGMVWEGNGYWWYNSKQNVSSYSNFGSSFENVSPNRYCAATQMEEKLVKWAGVSNCTAKLCGICEKGLSFLGSIS